VVAVVVILVTLVLLWAVVAQVDLELLLVAVLYL
jgi:hypothetical protein